MAIFTPFFSASVSQFSIKYLKQHSWLSLIRKEVPLCHRVNIFLLLGDKIGPERVICPLLLLYWELKLFPPVAIEVWFGTAEKKSLYPVGLTPTCVIQQEGGILCGIRFPQRTRIIMCLAHEKCLQHLCSLFNIRSLQRH